VNGARRAGEESVFFLVAGEASGDLLGAGLMRALRVRCGENIRFAGVGGPAMVAEGLKSLFPQSELSIMGVSGLFTALPKFARLTAQAVDAIVESQPDALIVIDSPDFTQRVAWRSRARLPELTVVNYVAPTVWAWRSWRAPRMRHYVDHVLALLPFEPAAYRELGGPPCTYVGHPIVERAGAWRPSPEENRRRMADPARVLALLGSRRAEIRRHARTFGATLAKFEDRPLEVVVPTLPALHSAVEELVAQWPVRARVISDRGEVDASFRTARAALAASGTVTLELALAGVPLVVAYRISLLEAFIAWLLVRVPSIVLANLVLGERVIPEFIYYQATPQALEASLRPLLDDTPERRRQVEAFKRLDALMEIGGEAPSAHAARVAMETVEAKRSRLLAS
jgi:lipid-A-disaccharide synthase